MCWEMDYHWLAEQKKAEETKAKQQQRSEAAPRREPPGLRPPVKHG
jgi:hypothetical protein